MFKKYSLILFFSFAIQGQTYAADNSDILDIFDQFITSGAAVSRCETPAKDILKHYIDNLQMVSGFQFPHLALPIPCLSNH